MKREQVRAGSNQHRALRVIKSGDKLKQGVRALNLLMEHQGVHTKPLTVTSAGEEEAKGGVNRSW